jgi:hypothetical protein
VRALVAPITAVLLSLAAAVASAQGATVAVTSTVDRTTMAVGDQLLLTVAVDLANGYTLLDPGVPRAIGDFEVVDTLTVLQTRGQGGVTRIQLRFLITAFQLGPKRVPPIGVTYRGPDGKEGQARTPAGHQIAVESVIKPGEDTSDVKPLKPPLPVPGPTNDPTRYVPVVAVGILVVLAAILTLRSRRPRSVAVPAATHGPARATLDELERVLEMALPEKGRTREHYDLVSGAVRTFISERYGVPAAARTARELRRELERAGVGRSAAQLMTDVLGDAESVRYEQRLISPAQAKRSMRDLIELMRRSVVAEEYELVAAGTTA